MKITPVQVQSEIKQVTTNNSDARAKAIAAFNNANKAVSEGAIQGNAQEHVVQNANSISPEEMSAVVAKKVEATDNSTNNVDTSVVSEPEQPAAVEAAKPVEVKPDPEVERRFTELAKQEKILRAKAQKQQDELEARENALKAKEQELLAKAQKYDQGYLSKDKLKSDPLSVLAEAGLSYDELTQQIINQQPTDPRVLNTITKLEAKIQQLEEAAEKAQQSSIEQQENSYKQAVKQIERDATKLVQDDPEAYEAISNIGAVSDVVKLIEETYKKDGILLTVEEAAQEVENYLIEEYYERATKIEKIKKRLAESQVVVTKPKQETEVTQAKTEQPQMKTLTNATSSTRKLSSRERALLAFKGELK